MKTTPLFEDPTTYASDRANADVLRRLALGGVLQVHRAGMGWSVEQAAVHAGMGHMTLRRVQDGYSVRSKTYAAIDGLFGLKAGSVARALGDDLLMVALIRDVAGVDTDEVTAGTAAAFVERFAQQTLTPAAKETVVARTSIGMAPTSSSTDFAQAVQHAAAALSSSTTLSAGGSLGTGRAVAPAAAVPDITAVADVIDRLTRRHLTPALDAAVRALLDAMPDLIKRQDELDDHDSSDSQAVAYG